MRKKQKKKHSAREKQTKAQNGLEVLLLLFFTGKLKYAFQPPGGNILKKKTHNERCRVLIKYLV